MQRCLSGRKSTIGNRVKWKLPQVQILFSAPKKQPIKVVFCLQRKGFCRLCLPTIIIVGTFGVVGTPSCIAIHPTNMLRTACLNFLYYSLCVIAFAIRQLPLPTAIIIANTLLKWSSVSIKCHQVSLVETSYIIVYVMLLIATCVTCITQPINWLLHFWNGSCDTCEINIIFRFVMSQFSECSSNQILLRTACLNFLY